MSVNEDNKIEKFSRWKLTLERDDNPSYTIREILKELTNQKDSNPTDQVFFNTYLPSFIKLLLDKRYYQYHDLDYSQILDLICDSTSSCLANLSKDLPGSFETLIKLLDYDKNLYDRHYSPIQFYTEKEIRSKFEKKFNKVEEFYYMNHNKSLNVLINLYLNFFGAAKGFESLSEFIKKASFDQITQIIQTIVNLDDIMPTTPWKRVSKAIYKETISAVNASPEDLKAVLKQDLRFFFMNLEKLLDKLYKSDKKGKILETLELEMAYKMLMTSVLEKRIYGITEIVNKITQAKNLDEDNDKRSRGFYVYKSEFREVAKWLTTDRLLDWLEDKDLVSVIFGPTSHHEVIKRSTDLVKFLYANSMFIQENLKNLWVIAFDKHEAEREALLNLIQDLVTVLDVEDLNFLYGKLKEVPFVQIDSQILQLLKSYARLGNYFKPPVKKPRKERIEAPLMQTPNSQTVLKDEDSKQPLNSAVSGGSKKLEEDEESSSNTSQDELNILENESEKLEDEHMKSSTNSEKSREEAIDQSKTPEIIDEELIESNEDSRIKNEDINKHPDEQEMEILDEEKPDLDSEELEIDTELNSKTNSSNPTPSISIFPFATSQNKFPTQPSNSPFPFSTSPPFIPSGQVLSSNNPAGQNNPLIIKTPGQNPQAVSFPIPPPAFPWNAGQLKIDPPKMSQFPSMTPVPTPPPPVTPQSLNFIKSQGSAPSYPVLGEPFQSTGRFPVETPNSSSPQSTFHRANPNDPTSPVQAFPSAQIPTHPPSFPPVLPLNLPPTPPNLPPNSSFHPNLPATFPRNSLPTPPPFHPPSLPPNLPPSLPPTLPPTLPPNLPPTLPPNLLPIHSTTLPQNLPPVPRPSLPPTLPPNMLPTSPSSVPLLPTPPYQFPPKSSNPSMLADPTPFSTSAAGGAITYSFQGSNLIHPSASQPTIRILPPPIDLPSYTPSKVEEPEKRFDSSEVLLFIWSLFQESAISQGMSLAVAEQAMTILKDSLINYFRGERPKYLIMCIDNVKRCSIVIWSCDMIKAILESYPSVRAHFDRNDSKSSMIRSLEQDNSLTKELYRSLIKFKHSALEKAVQISADESTSSSDEDGFNDGKKRNYDELFSGVFVSKEVNLGYLDEIKARLEFVKYLYSNSNESLENWHVRVLWETFILNAVSEKESDLVFNWLTSATNSWPNRIMASETLQVYIFTELLLKIKPSSYTQAALVCFERFFININRNHSLISSICSDDFLEIEDINLISMDALWEIMLVSRSEVVFFHSSNLIKRIYKGLRVCTQEIQESFIKRCMFYIESVPMILDEESVSKISRCLVLISDFIDEFDTKSPQDSITLSIQYKPRYSSMSNSSSISFSPLTCWSEARSQIIDLIKADPFPIFLHKNQVLEKISDFTTLRDLNIEDKSIIIVKEQDLDDENLEIPPPVESESSLQGLKSIFENLSDDLLKLALEKCDNQIDEAVCFLTGEGNIESLQEQLVCTSKPVKVTPRYKLTEILSNDHAYFSQLFELFSYGNLQINLKIWQLLNKVSVNVKAFEEIKQLNDCINWDNLFDSSCMFKLLYSLQIADEIMAKDFDGEWMEKLFRKGGLGHLYSVFIRYKELNLQPDGPFESKVIDYLIRIFTGYLSPSCEVDEAKSIMNLSELLNCTVEIVEKSLISNQSTGIVLTRSLEFLVMVLEYQPELMDEVYRKGIFEHLISDVLLKSTDIFIRQSICRTVESIRSIGSVKEIPDPSSYFSKIILRSLPQDDNQNCEEFFALAKSCYMDLAEADPDLLSNCINFVKSREILESRKLFNQDKVLTGYIWLLKPLLSQHQESRSPDLLIHLYNSLFMLEVSDPSNPPPNYKHTSTRSAAFDLIQVLCIQNPINSHILLEKLYFHHSSQKTSQGEDLSSPSYASRVDNEIRAKAASGFVGLRNFGSTCYMNSLMQQLFMMDQVRQGILQAELKSDLDLQDNVLYQLQYIMANLQESEKEYFEPFGFCQAFKCYDGEPINVRVQQDVDEFLSLLLDKLEEMMKGTRNSDLLRELIGGSFIHEIESTENEKPYYGSRDEHFFRISLDVKNKKNLQEALDLFVKDDMLEGDNKYFCDKYETKITAKKRCLINTMANTVLINLKRFEFDYTIMQRFKINDYCEFPLSINFKNWAKEQERSWEYYEYELAGVLLHSGGADSGHYTSIIKDRKTGKWYLFDDRYVEDYSIENLKSDCFGGEKTIPWGSDYHSYSQTKNAYLLVYERKFPISVKENEESTGISFISQIFDKIRAENMNFLRDLLYFDRGYFKLLADFTMNFDFQPDLNYATELSETKDLKQLKAITKYVEEDDRKSWITKEFLNNSPEIKEIVSKIEEETEYEDDSLKLIKLGTLFAYENLTRVKNFDNFKFWLRILLNYYEKHIKASIWFLNYLIQNREIISEIILECNDSESRTEFSNFISKILCFVSASEEEILFNKVQIVNPTSLPYSEYSGYNYFSLYIKKPQAVSARFIELYVRDLLHEFKRNSRKIDDYLSILSKFSECGYKQKLLLIEMDCISELVSSLNESDSYGSLDEVERLFELLGVLIVLCRTHAMRDSENLPPGFTKPGADLDPITESQTIDYHIKRNMVNNIRDQSVQKIVLHLSFENLKTSVSFLEEFSGYMLSNKFETFKVTSLLIILQNLLLIDDSIKMRRLHMFLTTTNLKYCYSMPTRLSFWEQVQKAKETHCAFAMNVIIWWADLMKLEHVEIVTMQNLAQFKWIASESYYRVNYYNFPDYFNRGSGFETQFENAIKMFREKISAEQFSSSSSSSSQQVADFREADEEFKDDGEENSTESENN